MKRRPTAEEWVTISALFDAALEAPPERRAALLTGRTGDPFIRGEVDSLLAAALATGVLDSPVAPPPHDAADVAALTPGTAVGAFEVERMIGRGGSGEVYLARRRTSDFEQHVALKLLQPEMSTQAAAFEAERRLLSRLNHPGIARLIDGGTAADGRLFTAMELVDGTDIATWCRERNADLPTRLRLFAEVCAAVASAHRQLVVHRDLKPSNIMVDSGGRVRLLDFGIAGLFDPAGGAVAAISAVTPAYAAPEQFEGAPPSTAMDVYGLGAVLFELLTGREPWPSAPTAMPAALRRLLNAAPPVPSVVAARPDASVAARLLTGDLDAIVTKAMQPDPAARYQSVEDLAEDIERHRTRHPVAARPAARGYRIARFIQRNPAAIAATAVAVVALAAGAVGIALQMQATAVERDIAREEATRAEAINDAVSLMFGEAGDRGKAKTGTAKDLLDMNAARLVETVDPANPSHAAQVVAVAELYAQIDDVTSADALLTRALEKGVGQSDPVMTAELKLQAGIVKTAQGAIAEARRLLAEAQPVWEASPERYRVQLLEADSAQASLLSHEGKIEEAVQRSLNALPEAEKVYAPGSREILQRYVNLAIYLIVAGRLDECAAMLDRAEAAAAAGGRQRTGSALTILAVRGMLAGRRSDHAEMERYMRQAVDLRRELFGPSAGLAVELHGLGQAMLSQGKAAEALPVLQESAAMAEQHLGRTAAMLPLYSSLLEALVKVGQLDGAEELVREIDPLTVEAGQTMGHGMYLRSRATLHLTQGRLDECAADLDAAEAIFRAIGPSAEPLIQRVNQIRDALAAARG